MRNQVSLRSVGGFLWCEATRGIYCIEFKGGEVIDTIMVHVPVIRI